MHYRAGHPAPIQYSADALHYLCQSLFRMARGESLDPPPKPLGEQWLTDFWWINRKDEPEEEPQTELPEDFLDSYGFEVL